MDEKAAAATDRYRELFERSADPMLIIEGDRFVDCNDAAVRMLGYPTKEDVLSLHPSQISPPQQPDGRDSFEKANEYLAIVSERGNHRFEWEHVTAEGEPFHVEVLLTAVHEGPDLRFHVVWRDLSDRRLLEESLRHSQKMDAVGKLAGGVAHDFNNLLFVILGHADLLKEDLTGKEESLEHVETIRGAVLRAAVLVRQLLAFGRKQQLLPEPLDLRALVEELRPLMERLAGADLPLEIRSAGRPIFVEADRGQIEQVLLNLVSNARDATEGPGTLCIELRSIDASSEPALANGRLSPGEYAIVSVTDSGSGMPPDVVKKAFEPFFTTKGQEGTGLGLATAYGIAQQSGGTIDIESRVGVGTTVRLYLPITHRRPKKREEPGLGPETGGGYERILVVEDQKAVGRLIRTALEDEGYEVHVAEDGIEGGEIYEREGPFDLVISDVILPRATGPEMVEKLEAGGHRPRVIFVSGYTNDALTARQKLRDDIELLHKPFSARDLSARVRSALETDGPRR